VWLVLSGISEASVQLRVNVVKASDELYEVANDIYAPAGCEKDDADW